MAGIVRTVLRLEQEGSEISYPTVLESLDGAEDREVLTGIAFRDDPMEGSVEDCLWACNQERLRQEQRETVRRLGRMEKDEPAEEDQPTTESVNEMLLRVQELARQRDALQ